MFSLAAISTEKMIVSAKRRGRGHGGWSKNNPYLQERWVEFQIDILPAYLVQRLLPVREQLSQEFERDLGIIQTVDGMIMESYFNRIRSESLSDSCSQPAFERISSHILANYTEVRDEYSCVYIVLDSCQQIICSFRKEHHLLYDEETLTCCTACPPMQQHMTYFVS